MRQIAIDFKTSPIEAGYLGEHNATEIVVAKPADLSGSQFSVAFQTNGEVIHSKYFSADEEIRVSLWQQLTQDNVLGVQLESYDENGAYIGKSATVRLLLKNSVHGTDVVADADNPDVYSEIAQNSSFRETLEDNLNTLDKLTTSETGKLLFDGKLIEGSGGGSSGGEISSELIEQIEANTDARHYHDNKPVLDKFGIDSSKIRPSFETKPLALSSDVPSAVDTTHVTNLMQGASADNIVNFASNGYLSGRGLDVMIRKIEELYAQKADIYTQEEIDEKISLIPKFSIEPVDTLPETDISETTVYLVRDNETDGNLYTEYIYVNGVWESLGSQSVDLTGYAKTEDIPTKTSQLVNDSGFITEEDLPDIPEGGNVDLSNYYTKEEIDEKGFITADDIPAGNFSQFIEQTADSVNLYPPMVEGWTNNATLKSDGSENPNASGAYCITPPVSVLPNTTYTIKPVPWGGLPDANRGRAYNESGVALAKLSWIENADGTVSFTTPENASYIRFTVYKTNFDNSNSNITDIDIIIPIFNSVFMLVKGTTAPEEYEAFGEGKYRLKDIEIPLKSVNLENVNDKALPIFAPLASKKIANFGDSIFGNARPPEDVSTYLAEKTGAEVLNCAFGGCRMSQHTGHWDAFSMYRLAYAIANNDYSLQDEALNYDDRTSYAEEPLALIKATDFSNIDIVTIGYGTNDFTGNNTLDNSENPLDTSTVGGALRYSIEQLLTSYPNLRIFVLSTMYRFYIDNNNEFTEDSNTKVNSIGLKLSDYNAKLKEVAEEYNLPFIDNYNIGIGKFNRYQYFNANDGTHHNENGRKLIASHLAKELY